MSKTVLILTMAGLIAGCGSSSDTDNNPFIAVANDQPVATTPATVEPVAATPEPVAPETATPTEPVALPVTGTCLDYAPLNDGIGWNGTAECALPVTETEYVEVTEPVAESEPAVQPVVTIQDQMWCTTYTLPKEGNSSWVDLETKARLITFYTDGTLSDPDNMYFYFDRTTQYINVYDSNWEGQGLSRVTDNYFSNTALSCGNDLPQRPDLIATPVPTGFSSSGGLLGQWTCQASGGNWDSTWNLSFQSDNTVLLQDGSNSLHDWNYVEEVGVAIRWYHKGVTTTYVLNAEDGGMQDDGSHCLRELPVVELSLTDENYIAMQNQSYSCGTIGSAYSQTRSTDGDGNWQGVFMQSGSQPITNSGIYTIIDDRLWWSDVTDYDTSGYFIIDSSDMSLSYPELYSNFCH